MTRRCDWRPRWSRRGSAGSLAPSHACSSCPTTQHAAPSCRASCQPAGSCLPSCVARGSGAGCASRPGPCPGWHSVAPTSDGRAGRRSVSRRRIRAPQGRGDRVRPEWPRAHLRSSLVFDRNRAARRRRARGTLVAGAALARRQVLARTSARSGPGRGSGGVAWAGRGSWVEIGRGAARLGPANRLVVRRDGGPRRGWRRNGWRSRGGGPGAAGTGTRRGRRAAAGCATLGPTIRRVPREPHPSEEQTQWPR